MKKVYNFKTFNLLESYLNKQDISIEDFIKAINIDENIDNIVTYWNENYSDIEIYYFDFDNGFLGVNIGDGKIAINKNFKGGMFPPSMGVNIFKLFILFHELRHNIQRKEGMDEGNDLYFNFVKNDNKEDFLKWYIKLEKDANDYAINTIEKLGFDLSSMDKMYLRGNEKGGNMIFKFMKSDIEKYNVSNFYDLIKKQI